MIQFGSQSVCFAPDTIDPMNHVTLDVGPGGEEGCLLTIGVSAFVGLRNAFLVSYVSALPISLPATFPIEGDIERLGDVPEYAVGTITIS